MKTTRIVLIAVFLVSLASGAAMGAQSPQIPLAGSAIPQFVDPLPDLSDLGAIGAGAGQITLNMSEFRAEVLPTGTFAPGVKPKTWVWGYLPVGQDSRTTYLGAVIVATRGQPTEMKFVNNLDSADTTNVLAYKYGTDQTLHWADPLADEANECNMKVATGGFEFPFGRCMAELMR